MDAAPAGLAHEPAVASAMTRVMSVDPLRRLLDQLIRADAERHRMAPQTPEYEDASRQVDQLARRVWDLAAGDRTEHAAVPDGTPDER